MTPSATPPQLLFVVDDDERTARRLASMLTEDGYVVEVMLDGQEAIDRFGHEPPPVAIVTDHVMPRAHGVAVLLEARKRWPQISVIFITGRPDLLAGLVADPRPVVFTKPVSYADLNTTLRDILGASIHV